MNKKYTHIFFDLDHTLWDFETNSRETLAHIFTDLGIDKRTLTDFEGFYQKYKYYNRLMWQEYELGKIAKEELRTERFNKTLIAIGINDLALSYEFGNQYVKLSPYKTALIPHSMDVLNYLADKKYKLHIITNGFEEVQHIKLKNSELDIFFEHTITSEQAGTKKPSLGIFNHAFKTTGATSQDSIIIGDSFHSDIIGGMSAGMDTVYFNPERQKQSKKPTHDISCLSELYDIL